MSSTFAGRMQDGSVPAESAARAAAEPPPAPRWFRAKDVAGGSSAGTESAAPKATNIVAAAAQDEVSRPLWRRAALWLVGFAGAGYGISLLVHAVLLTGLSVWIVQFKSEQAVPLRTVLEYADGMDLEAELEMAADFSGGPQSEIVQPQLQPVPDVIPNDTELPVPDDLLADIGKKIGQPAGGSTGAGQVGDGPGEGVTGAVGRNAVRQGSFVVWTVPASPRPYQPYQIVVQIDVPEDVKDYDRKDLSGTMTGTDDWTTPIGHYRGDGNLRIMTPTGYFTYPAGYYGYFNRTLNRLVVKDVPGAARLVRDRIVVHSDLLNETQEIEIVFDQRRSREPASRRER